MEGKKTCIMDGYGRILIDIIVLWKENKDVYYFWKENK